MVQRDQHLSIQTVFASTCYSEWQYCVWFTCLCMVCNSFGIILTPAWKRCWRSPRWKTGTWELVVTPSQNPIMNLNTYARLCQVGTVSLWIVFSRETSGTIVTQVFINLSFGLQLMASNRRQLGSWKIVNEEVGELQGCLTNWQVMLRNRLSLPPIPRHTARG